MSDPVANVQIEDVLSSIRRLVSEEIGQQEPLKLRQKRVENEDELKLVLSPAQKIRQDAAEQGSDLWEATEEMAPVEAAPVWWHRDASELSSNEPDEPEVLDEPVASKEEPAEITAEPSPDPEGMDAIENQQEPEPEPTPEPEPEAQSLADAPIDIDDDDFEPPEGEENIDIGVKIDAMPWQDDDDANEYTGAVQGSDDVSDDAPFTFRPGERLFERLSSKKMSASHLPEVETVESSARDEDEVEVTDPELDALLHQADTKTEEIGVTEAPSDFEDTLAEPDPVGENYFDADEGTGDLSNIFDEDMLRDLVKDIIRQELQGVLGERITRNVRKLVRREIQRAMSDVNKI